MPSLAFRNFPDTSSGVRPFQWIYAEEVNNNGRIYDMPEINNIPPYRDVDNYRMGVHIDTIRINGNHSCDVVRAIGMDIGIPFETRDNYSAAGQRHTSNSVLQVSVLFSRQGTFHTDGTLFRHPESWGYMRCYIERFDQAGSFIGSEIGESHFFARIDQMAGLILDETRRLDNSFDSYAARLIVPPGLNYRLWIDIVGHVAANQDITSESSASARFSIDLDYVFVDFYGI